MRKLSVPESFRINELTHFLGEISKISADPLHEACI